MGQQVQRTICLATGILIAIPAAALEGRVAARYTAEFTSNVNQSASESNEDVSDWIHRPGATINLTHEAAGLDLSASYLIEQRIYQDDSYEDETSAVGQGRLSWDPIENRWNVTIGNSVRRTLRDTQDRDTPNNQQRHQLHGCIYIAGPDCHR